MRNKKLCSGNEKIKNQETKKIGCFNGSFIYLIKADFTAFPTTNNPYLLYNYFSLSLMIVQSNGIIRPTVFVIFLDSHSLILTHVVIFLDSHSLIVT